MSATPQNLGNHRRYVPLYHYLLALLVLTNLFWAGWNLYDTPGLPGVFNLLLAIAILLIFYYVRAFPLAVQDRLIRLEERLRLRDVLPAELHGRIHEISADQLIGMRFASDAELPDLTREMLAGNLGGEEVKRKIREWRADDCRC